MKQEEILILDLIPLKSWMSNGLSHHRQDVIAMEIVPRTSVI